MFAKQNSRPVNPASSPIGLHTGRRRNLHIEATRYPGKGNITLTGQIGNVMKESVQAALSLLRSRDGQLGVKAEDFRKMDVHVHVPAGAVPKDGPSAGIAMFTALASLFCNRPVRSDVAMTARLLCVDSFCRSAD